MANSKEKIEELESNVSLVREEIRDMNTSVDERLKTMGEAFNQSMEESFNRMMETMRTMMTNREGGGSTQRDTHRRDEQTAYHHPTLRGEHTALVPRRNVKLEFPRFSGGDPTEWMSKATQYFTYHEMPRHERVIFASYHFTEEANQWWQAKSKAIGLPVHQIPWERFEVELWTRFGPIDGEDFDEALCHIQQKGSLLEFQREFEKLQNRVEGWTEKALVGAFMGGLHKSISSGIRIFKPRTLLEVINLARLRDEQLQQEKRWSNPRSHFNKSLQPNSRTDVTTTLSEKPAPSPKRLSWDELKKKRSLGLCFSCDEKYSPGHRCKQPQLFIMEGAEDDKSEPEEVEEEGDTHEITLHALTGWNAPKTIRLHAKIKNQHLLALVDSGSTHNFISDKMVQGIKLQAAVTKPFEVRVANGSPLRCHRKYEKVVIQLGDAKFEVTLYALPLVGLDLVMGMHWLESLGPMLCDWKAQTLQFEWQDRQVMLNGLRPTTIRPTTHQDMEKEERQGQLLFAVCATEKPQGLQPLNDDMRALVNQFEDIFQTPTGLPLTRTIEHHINLKEGTNPINVRPYRYAYFQKDEIERQVTEMLQSGIIRPSSSPFSSPVLLVKKKDGSWRFCTDYRALNSATIKDRFPIPTVEDMLDELHGAVFFTKLDLTARYHQVRMHSADIHKTAFRTHHGHYEYLVMPFGLCNAPSTFQALMNDIFRPLLRRFVLVFFDDILIYSSSWELHLQHVKEVLTLIREHQLSIKLKKCDFGKNELEYLGHIITHKGVKADCSKIKAMTDWPTPTTVTELRGFLGLTGYYRKKIRDYGIIARPLTNLLRKGRFVWEPEAEEAFQKLKTAMTTTPTLALPDFSKPFVITTDASGDGIGAVLSQNNQPIAFMSRSLGVTKRSWSTYAREMLAILVAIRTWRPYLMGRRFTIQTDQRSLRYMLDQRILTPEQQK